MTELAPQETKIETRGRPKLPETVVKELKEKIVMLENQILEGKKPFQQMKELTEILRLVMRAMKGLDEKDDNFLGLIDVDDTRERTRLDEVTLLGHSAMHAFSSEFPEFSYLERIAEKEDHYYISEDGLGRQEAVGMIAAKANLAPENIINMNSQPEQANPQNQQGQPTQPPKKKGFFNKLNIFKR